MTPFLINPKLKPQQREKVYKVIEEMRHIQSEMEYGGLHPYFKFRVGNRGYQNNPQSKIENEQIMLSLSLEGSRVESSVK